MATRYLAHCIFTTATKQSVTTSFALSRSFTSASDAAIHTNSIFCFRQQIPSPWLRKLAPFSTTTTRFCSPNNREKCPEIDWGLDYKHWIVLMEKPKADTFQNRDEIIDSYIKTLAMVVGSEQEAGEKIYSTTTNKWHTFGALVSEEDAAKLEELPYVSMVLPDSYIDTENKIYGGEPFAYGQPTPKMRLASNMQQEVHNCDLKHVRMEKDKNLQIGGVRNMSASEHLSKSSATPLTAMTTVAAPGIDEWRLFMECVIRFKRLYLNSEDMMYRFEVFKGKLETSDEPSRKDGCRNKFNRSFDLSRDELRIPAIHKLIARSHGIYLSTIAYRKDAWIFFMDYVVSKKRIYKSSEDMMHGFERFKAKLKTIIEDRNKESKNSWRHGLTPFDISEAELAAS